MKRIRPLTRRSERKKRYGIAAIEVVMATAVGVPMAAGMFFLAREGCQAFLDMASVVIGWPHL